MRYVPPSIGKTAFNCPHCNVLTTQYWHRLYAVDVDSEDDLPAIIEAAQKRDFSDIQPSTFRAEMEKWYSRGKTGLPFLEKLETTTYAQYIAWNMNVSRCYECDELSIWLQNDLVFPLKGDAPEPNPDLSNDVKRDYNEASLILNQSPRGAAALLRLCVQKLCKEFGEPGRDINADIGSLVSKGLDKRVQKALDAVRVIGNEAVHPGQIDLSDDRATAETLFRLINLIADKMISEPKHVDAIFDSLPASKLAGIEARDKPRS